jgi:hypothetical protein
LNTNIAIIVETQGAAEVQFCLQTDSTLPSCQVQVTVGGLKINELGKGID